MTNKQSSKLKMYLALRIFLKTNTTLITTLPNVNEFLTDLDKAIILIQTNSENQLFKSSGIADDKKQNRDKLEIMILDNAGRLAAYAKYAKNNLLIAESRFSMSSLKNNTDLELVEISNGIYNRIETKITELSTYGLTAATQTLFKTSTDVFNTAIPAVRQTQVSQKENTLQINKGISEADVAIDNLDTLVEMLRFSNPVFYTDYKATRMIIDAPSIALAVKGMLVDVDGNAVKGVDITFMDKNNNHVVVLKKKTAEKGGFTVKSIPEGEYGLMIGKTGYISQTMDIVVNNTETTVINIEIIKK